MMTERIKPYRTDGEWSQLKTPETGLKSQYGTMTSSRHPNQSKGVKIASPYSKDMFSSNLDLDDQLKTDDTKGEQSKAYLLKEVLPEIMRIEGKMEESRKELAYRYDATAEAIWGLFTTRANGVLSCVELMYGFERLGLVCDVTGANLVAERYDPSGEKKLNFEKFKNMVLPINPVYRMDILQRQPRKEISMETKDMIKRLLREVIDAEAMVESLRQRAKASGLYDNRKAFDALDWRYKGFLTSSELKVAYEEHREWLGKSSNYVPDCSVEIESVLRRINKDQTNGRVTLV
jgi:hypothetical protein